MTYESWRGSLAIVRDDYRLKNPGNGVLNVSFKLLVGVNDIVKNSKAMPNFRLNFIFINKFLFPILPPTSPFCKKVDWGHPK